MSNNPKEAGRYAYSLERLMHEPSRLGILSSLAAHPDGLLFNDLKVLVNLTDGNLSRQIQILQDEGLIGVEKSFVKNRPQTRCRLTDEGRARFLEYITQLERVIRDAAAVEAAAKQLRSALA